MVRDDVCVRSNQNAESCVRTLPLSGMPEPEHVVERRDAIGGDHEQRVAAVEDVADLALPLRSKAVQTRFEQGSSEWQRDGPASKRERRNGSILPG